MQKKFQIRILNRKKVKKKIRKIKIKSMKTTRKQLIKRMRYSNNKKNYSINIKIQMNQQYREFKLNLLGWMKMIKMLWQIYHKWLD